MQPKIRLDLDCYFFNIVKVMTRHRQYISILFLIFRNHSIVQYGRFHQFKSNEFDLDFIYNVKYCVCLQNNLLKFMKKVHKSCDILIGFYSINNIC